MGKGKIFEGAFNIKKIFESSENQMKAEKRILFNAFVSGNYRAQKKHDGLHIGAYKSSHGWDIDYRGVLLQPEEGIGFGPYRSMIQSLHRKFNSVEAYPGTYIQVEYSVSKPSLLIKSPTAVLSVNKATKLIQKNPFRVEYSITNSFPGLEETFARALGYDIPKDVVLPLPAIDTTGTGGATTYREVHEYLMECAPCLYAALNSVGEDAEGFVIRTATHLFKLQKDFMTDPETRAKRKASYFLDNFGQSSEYMEEQVKEVIEKDWVEGMDIRDLIEISDLRVLDTTSAEKIWVADRAYQIMKGKIVEQYD